VFKNVPIFITAQKDQKFWRFGVHVVLHWPVLAAKVWPVLLTFLTGLGPNRDDTDEATLPFELQTAKRFQRSGHEFGFLSAHLGHNLLFIANHLKGLDRLTLAKCESALRQRVHREYLLAAVDGRQGSRQRTNFQVRWMAQPIRVEAVYPNWDAYQGILTHLAAAGPAQFTSTSWHKTNITLRTDGGCQRHSLKDNIALDCCRSHDPHLHRCNPCAHAL